MSTTGSCYKKMWKRHI